MCVCLCGGVGFLQKSVILVNLKRDFYSFIFIFREFTFDIKLIVAIKGGSMVVIDDLTKYDGRI